MQTFVEWEVCICYTEVFSASEKLDAQTIPNLWLSQLYSDFVLETGRDSTLFSGLRFIFLDVTFGWRFSQERHFDDATAQASHFFQQAFVVCVWISNTSLVEHAGDTSQCATMNLCVQEYLERYFSLCAVEAFPYQFGIWKADCPCKRLQQIQATVLLLERV